jgi:hypothetical protein
MPYDDIVAKSLFVIHRPQWQAEFAFDCPGLRTHSYSDRYDLQSMLDHSVPAIHGSITNMDPRLTPRIFPDTGSRRFTVLPCAAAKVESKASWVMLSKRSRSAGSHA